MKKELVTKLQNYFNSKEIYEFVILFGSLSNDEEHAFSDVDIGVYFKGDVDLMEIGYDAAKLEEMVGRRVDIAILNELYKKDPLFAYEIYSNHLPIVIKTEKKYVDFKRNALLYYLDHLPLIEQNRRSLAKRIEEEKAGERNYA